MGPVDTELGWGWENSQAPWEPTKVWNSNHTSDTAIDINLGSQLEVDRSLQARFRNWVILWRYRLNLRAHIARRIINRLDRIIFRLERWT